MGCWTGDSMYMCVLPAGMWGVGLVTPCTCVCCLQACGVLDWRLHVHVCVACRHVGCWTGNSMYMCVLPAGMWGVGLGTGSVQVDTVPLGKDQQSWVMTSDGNTLHNGEVLSELTKRPAEGDIVVSISAIVGDYSMHWGGGGGGVNFLH